MAKSAKSMIENDIEKLLDKGQAYLYNTRSKGKLSSTTDKKKALVCFEKVLKLDPKNETALYKKGSALHLLKKYKEAIVCFDKALKLDPKAIGVWNHKAFTIDAIVNSKKNPEFAKSKYTFKDVIFCYDKALGLNRENPNSWYWMGEAYSRQGSINVWNSIDAIQCWFNAMMNATEVQNSIGYDAAHRARDTIHSVNQTCEDLIGTKIGLVDLSYNQKSNLREVIRICDSIQKFAQNTNPRTWNNKGCALMNLGKLKEAMACFDKILKPTDQMRKSWDLEEFSFVLYNKGLALRLLKKYKEAIICFDKALKLNPKSFAKSFPEPKNAADVWYGKGVSLSFLKKDKEAIRCLDKALKLEPKNAAALRRKGISLTFLKKYKEAIVCYDKALKLEPKNAVAWYNKGIALHGLKKYKEEIVCYDKVLKLDPKDAVAWYDKGSSLLFLKKYKESIVCFDKALKLEPKNAVAWYDKAISLKQLKKYKESLACSKKAVKLDPKWSMAWNNIGDGLFRLGKHDKAITCFKKAVEYDRENKTAKHNLFHLQQLLIDFID